MPLARRMLLAAGLSAPGRAAAQGQWVLTFLHQSDRGVLHPVFSSAYVAPTTGRWPSTCCMG